MNQDFEIDIETIFHHMRDCFVAADGKGTILVCNHKSVELLGYNNSKEVSQLNLFRNIFFPEVYDELNHGKTEVYFQKKNGSKVKVKINLFYKEFDRENNVKRISILFESALLLEETERYKLALMGANEEIWDYNLLTGMFVTNNEYNRTLGLDANEILSIENWHKKIHPDDREKTLLQLGNYIKGESSHFSTEFRIRTSSGDWKWILSRGRIIERNKDDVPVRMIGTNTDITEKKIVEENLKDFEKKLISVVEGSSSAIYFLECENEVNSEIEDFIFTYINKPGEKELGISRENLIGSGIKENFSIPNNRELFLKCRKVFETGIPMEEEYHFINKNSVRLWYYQHIKPMKNGVVIFDRNITDQKNQESEKNILFEKLRDSEAKLKALIEKSPIGIFIVDQSGKYVFSNQAGAKLVGYEVKELLNLNIIDMSSKEVTEENKKQFEKLMKHGEIFFETRLKRKDGYTIDVILDAVRISEREYLGFCREITEKKTAERQVLEREYMLKEAERISNMGSWEIDFVTGKTIWSDNFFHICGFPIQSFIPTYELIISIVHPADRKLLSDVLEKSIQDKKNYEIQYRIVRPDGETRWALNRTEIIFNGHGETLKLKGTVVDITELKRIEEELIIARNKAEESDQLKSSFLSNISHEIRTPMNAVLGFSELLSEDNSSPEEKRKYLDIIRSSANQLMILINDILDISKLDVKQIKLKFEKCSLNDLFSELKLQFNKQKILNNKPDIEINTSVYFDDKNSFIYTDRIRLQQILNNLIVNSLKYTNSGFIKFGYLLKSPNTLLFYVSDSGKGIDTDKQKVIFDRFRQVDESSSAKFGGVGLGLPIAKGMVELFEGSIWLESVINIGTTFYFTIPFKPVKVEAEEIKTEPAMKNEFKWKGKTILIAEDVESNFIYLKKILENSEVTIFNSVDGLQTLELFKKENPDLILMDIDMPEMDGYEAAREIRKINKDIPIIAQTAYAFENEKQKCIENGCNDYISKPINKMKLLSMIQLYFDKS